MRSHLVLEKSAPLQFSIYLFHQVHITVSLGEGDTKAAWYEHFAQHCYTWPAGQLEYWSVIGIHPSK